MGAAHGWDGDRYRVVEDETGRRSLVWWSVWDDAAAADRFARAADAALAGAPHEVAGQGGGGRAGVYVRIGPASITAGRLECPMDAPVCTVH